MATNWNQEQQSVYNDLQAEGVMFTFTRKGRGEYDPVHGEYATVADSTFTAPGIEKMINNNSNSNYAQQWFKNLPVEVGDKVLLLGCGTYTPELEDLVDIDGNDWIVKGHTPLRPGMIDLLRYVLVRKS